MKKSLVLALLSGLCFCAPAAFQYKVIEGPKSKGIDGPSFFVRITEGSGLLYVLDLIEDKKDYGDNKDLLSKTADMAAKKYGYIDNKTGKVGYGDGTTITTYTYENPKGKDPNVVQTGYKLGDFNEGDEIGIWLTSNKGEIGASIGNKSDWFNSGIEEREAFDGKDAFGKDIHEFEFHKGKDISFGFYGVPSTVPTGKPLPGVLATLLLGSGALGALGMKKKRAKRS